MLTRLREIVEKVASAPRLNEALNILVTDICLAMETEVCSVYLADHELALDPLRQVVLLILEDAATWRLAKADRSVKEWIIKKTNESAPTTPADPDEKPPPGA